MTDDEHKIYDHVKYLVSRGYIASGQFDSVFERLKRQKQEEDQKSSELPKTL